jgi:amino acid permease
MASINSMDSYYDLLNTKMYNIANEPNQDILAARWNTYYYKKYKSQNNILLFIIGICALIIILKLIHKSYPFFDNKSYTVLVGIILGITVIIVGYLLWNILYKDSSNFDEFDYSYYDNKEKPNSKVNSDISFNQFDCLEEKVNTLANFKF